VSEPPYWRPSVDGPRLEGVVIRILNGSVPHVDIRSGSGVVIRWRAEWDSAKRSIAAARLVVGDCVIVETISGKQSVRVVERYRKANDSKRESTVIDQPVPVREEPRIVRPADSARAVLAASIPHPEPLNPVRGEHGPNEHPIGRNQFVADQVLDGVLGPRNEAGLRPFTTMVRCADETEPGEHVTLIGRPRYGFFDARILRRWDTPPPVGSETPTPMPVTRRISGWS
jgi:hypothetical protein